MASKLTRKERSLRYHDDRNVHQDDDDDDIDDDYDDDVGDNLYDTTRPIAISRVLAKKN